MIKTGRYGTVKYDAAGTTPVVIVSVNGWKLSLKTDYEDVTCYGDENKVYVPGMKDVSGSLAGFWNSDDTTLVEAADAAAPGLLELSPNATEPTFNFSGLAYMDADIDATVKGAPKLSATFKAAGPWSEGWVTRSASSIVVPATYAPGSTPPYGRRQGDAHAR